MKTFIITFLLLASSLCGAHFQAHSIPILEESYRLDSSENTPLFVAIATGDFQKAENLLKNGANPNEKSIKGASVFTALALSDDEQGSIKFFHKLISYGANTHTIDRIGNTGLHTAIAKKRYLLAQQFIQHEEFNNYITKYYKFYKLNHFNRTILHMFYNVDLSDPHALETLEMVLSKTGIGIINEGDLNGDTIFHYIVSPGSENIELLQFLSSLPKTDINIQNHINQNVPILISLLSLNHELDAALQQDHGHSPDLQKIELASQIVQILWNAFGHNITLAITNSDGLSPEDLLLTLEEKLLKLPQDSSIHVAVASLKPMFSAILNGQNEYFIRFTNKPPLLSDQKEQSPINVTNPVILKAEVFSIE